MIRPANGCPVRARVWTTGGTSFVLGSVRLTQRAPAAGQLRQVEGIPAEHIDVVPGERGEPRAQSLALFDALAAAEKTLHANPASTGRSRHSSWTEFTAW